MKDISKLIDEIVPLKKDIPAIYQQPEHMNNEVKMTKTELFSHLAEEYNQALSACKQALTKAFEEGKLCEPMSEQEIYGCMHNILHNNKEYCGNCDKLAKALVGKVGKVDVLSEEDLAVFMHTNYELLAIDEGWSTQEKCKVKFDDLPEANKRVMLKLAKAIKERLKNV
ncbi:MAG: hypothetical protein WC810_03105 [Janthinobacterium sp.]|jgi:hypothetical protein